MKFDTWFWVDPAEAQTVSVSDSEGVYGLVVTVELRPTPDFLWIETDDVSRSGQRERLVCSAGGTPFRFDVDPSRQRSACTHAYFHSSGIEDDGVFEVETSTRWERVWSCEWPDGSSCGSGSLPVLTMTGPVRQLAVDEILVVNTWSS